MLCVNSLTNATKSILVEVLCSSWSFDTSLSATAIHAYKVHSSYHNESVRKNSPVARILSLGGSRQ